LRRKDLVPRGKPRGIFADHQYLLGKLGQYQNCWVKRFFSYDHTGGNQDSFSVEPWDGGEKTTI
jgi:hypothetical protein